MIDVSSVQRPNVERTRLATLICAIFRKCTDPDSMMVIKKWAFAHCYALSSIILGENVSSVEYAAFRHSGLTYLAVHSSLTVLEDFAFSNCTNLNTVNFTGTQEPESGIDVFGDCDNIRSVFVPTDYEGDTLLGLPITKHTDENMDTGPIVNTALVVSLICIFIFGMIEIMTSYISSYQELPEEPQTKRNLLSHDII